MRREDAHSSLSPLRRGSWRGLCLRALRITSPSPSFVRRGSVVILIGILLLVAFLSLDNKPCANFNEKTITVPSGALSIALVQTPEQQARGLSGCKNIPPRSGMLFPLAERREATFWMKGMLIPIDIVWIADNRVLGVEQNVPYPKEQVPEADFPVYSSPGEVDAVLEVEAGKANEYGLVEGAEVAM